jgi:XTP/dITP diphosphohydrolase
MQSLLLATTNAGKIREIRAALGDRLELVTLVDLPPVIEPEETGRTFEENAILKAEYYAAAHGLPTVAEDSGLAIDALGGRPGIESARYPGATYADKFQRLYAELAPHPKPWTAQFVCALAFVDKTPNQALGVGHSALAPARVTRASAPTPASAHRQVPSAYRVLFTARGVIDGEIAAEPRGSNGFGYDPIFFYSPYGCTLGEVDDARKLVVSHRGQAFRALRRWLEHRAP